MRYADLYTKVILTIIAVLLVWNTLAPARVPASTPNLHRRDTLLNA